MEDEEHVLLACPKTNFAREKFGIKNEDYSNLGVLMDSLDFRVLVLFVDCCMNVIF